MSEVAFRVNGDPVAVLGDPMRRLSEVLRDDLGLTGTKVGFFTTYSILTGSMFGKMRRELADRAGSIGLELKSRDGMLSAGNRSSLDRFVAGGAT